MAEYEKVNEIQETMNGFLYQEFVGILILTILGSVVLACIIFTNKKCNGNWGFACIVITLASLITFLIILSNYLELHNELKKAELDVVMSISDTTTLTATKIAASKPTYEKYCPHVELKKDEICTYVELVSEGKTTQVFIPLKSGVYADSENPLKVTYLKLTEEDRDFLNKYMEVKDASFYDKFGIYPSLWSLGVSITD